MKKFFYPLLNDLMVVLNMTLAVKITDSNTVYGIFAWIIALICLDLHSYIDKKLNYPNNLFIKR
jgi:hypothetical protein